MRRRLSTLLCLALALPAAAGQRPPKWINGSDPAYPESAYMVGVGIGDDLEGARSNARAEISRTFQARVQQTLTDTQTESSASLGRRRGAAAGTQKSEMTTNVVTDSLLEGVQVPHTYFDKKRKKNYALAVLDKRTARRNLSMQVTEKEEGIHTRLAQAEDADSPLSKAKALGQALSLAKERDALSARLRVVDAGSAVPDLANGSSTGEIDKQLTEVLSKIQFSVDADGGPGSRLQQAVSGRVAELGFKVTAETDAPLQVKADIDVKPFDRGNPQWKFYHWEATVELTEKGKVVASSTPSGEEGHLVESTAESKARTAGEEAVGIEAQKMISSYVFGQ